MAEYLDYPTSPAATLTGGRRGLLIGFGVAAILVAGVLIGITGLSALMILRLTVWSNANVTFPPRSLAAMAASNVTALALAAAIAWAGVAMVRCRRWVLRAGRVAAALALASGVLGFELMLAQFVIEEELIPGTQADATSFVIALLAIGFFGVVIPAAYLVLFTRPGVRRTLEHYDPAPNWADHLPAPVLAVRLACLYFGLAAATWVGEQAEYCFGRFVTSDVGLVAIAATWSVLLLATAAASLLHHGLAWCLALTLCITYSANVLLTLWLGDPHALYGDAALVDSGYAATRLKQWPLVRMNQTILCLLYCAAVIIYLLRNRRHFFAPAPVTPATAPLPVAATADAPAPPRTLTPPPD